MPSNLDQHTYLDAADWTEAPSPTAASSNPVPTPPPEGYKQSPSLRLNWPGLSTPDSLRQAYAPGTKISRFLPTSNNLSSTPAVTIPQGENNSVYATPLNGGNGTASLQPLSTFPASAFPALNQNTTGTASGLTGTPNITVGTITSGNVAVTGTVAVSSYFACNGATAVAPTSGWGAPTSASVVNNFNGSGATTAQIQAAVAEIITVLLAAGIIKA